MNAVSPFSSIPHTPRSLNTLYDDIVLQAIKDKVQELNFLICVQGNLGQIPATRYKKHYEVPLTYEDETIYLDIPCRLLEATGLQAGDYVSALGRVSTNQFRGKLAFRLDVCEIRPQETPEVKAKRRQEQLKLEVVPEIRTAG